MKYVFIALLIICPLIIFAQANYHEGYILKNNGDTLKGYINYRDWSLSPTSIEFKGSRDNNVVQQFDPQTIKGFQISGLETYISYIGLVSTNKNIFPDLPSQLDTNKQTAAIFLRQLTTGAHLTLYYNNEIKKNRFFIAETYGRPVELQYYEYYTNSSSQEVFDNTYLGQLLLLINKFRDGNQRLLSILQQTKFNSADLKSIVNEINNDGIKGQGNEIGPQKESSNIRLFAGIGANNTITRYNYSSSLSNSTNTLGNISTNLNMSSYHSTTVAPTINLGIDILVNPNVQQFIFRAELSYSYADGSFNRPVTADNSVVTNYNYSFTQRNATIKPQLIYNFYNTDKLKFYVDGGVGINLSSYADKTTGTNPTPLILQSVWASYSLQAGVVFNRKIEIYFNYNTFTTYSDPGYVDFTIANQTTCIGVKYLFK